MVDSDEICKDGPKGHTNNRVPRLTLIEPLVEISYANPPDIRTLVGEAYDI